MLELVRQLLPDVGEPLMLTLNKSVTCARHRDGRNASDYSYIMFFDGERPFSGGELVLEEPEGDRVLSEKNVWHKFCGRETITITIFLTKGTSSALLRILKHVPRRKAPGAPQPRL